MITTRIRFLKPVKPEKVWAFGRRLIGAPLDYRWEEQVGGLNPAFDAYPGQVATHMRLEFGELVEPAAYAELTLTSPGWDLDEHYRHILRCHFGAGPITWQEEWSGEWFTNPDREWPHYVSLSIIGRAQLIRAGLHSRDLKRTALLPPGTILR